MIKLEFLHKVTARLKYNPLWAQTLRLSGSTLENKRWIFIIGCYNSGTTLLDQILATHPQISGLPDEGVMLSSELVRPEDFGWRRMWSECEAEMKLSSRNQNKNASTVKKQWSHFFDLEKPYLLEKSISNTCRIPFLNSDFQPAFFIHIVRNGYAVAEGIQRKAKIMENNPLFSLGRYPIEICAKQWVRSLEVVEQQKNYLNNFLEIKYEDLTDDPEAVVNQITGFLSIQKMDPEYFSNSFEIHEKKSRIANMNQSSFQRLLPEEIKAINEVSRDFLIKYGYKVL